MSTASPLPLQPLPAGTVSEEEARALKREIANRLAEHRQRRGQPAETQSSRPVETAAPRHRVADSVAARFARSVSYSDFLKQEAEAAIRQAEAAAEVARRNAEAIAAAQQQLLDEIEQWSEPVAPQPEAQGPAEIIAFAAPVGTESPLGVSEAVTEARIVAVEEPVTVAAPVPQMAEPVAVPVVVEAVVPASPARPDFAQLFTAAVNEIQEKPATLAERLGLATGPLDSAVALPTNLIEFPRQLVAARKARPRLAEGPLRDEADAAPERAQLRIFEVEANAVSTEPVVESVLPEWHTIRLDVDAPIRTAESPDAQISFAMPLYVAPGSQRVMAFLVDACCVVTGFLMAVTVAAYASPVLPTGLPAVLASAATLFAFAIGYQTLFFSLSGTTPGMRYARISLCTFSDENPTRKAMLHRIFALLLAGMPVGLGLLWACMDEENLGWHDRISRMYPRGY
ncbi:RDD family protein [Terriglobus sp. RCC_193]|uniref:RDD family protein n=1 Tax=Terriglobus sp. RCC_193 TaxID=3239218 RepID=UPI0035250A0C